ncbi:hypothetical protein JFV29_07775 [Peribacillus sp. TH16]|uniref:hypothetical protein n=1 Tax=Peribacillus sp. TH16 TaxID=2798482 RepID=UPI001911A564|nr:hypothetical protein [Peribacillus sp. TH16]MBK5481835.1 hypothetical protein [Peribacillus sp. TH16]
MSTYDLIIRDGYVVLPDEVKKADIAVHNGVIVKVGNQLDSKANVEYEAKG